MPRSLAFVLTATLAMGPLWSPASALAQAGAAGAADDGGLATAQPDGGPTAPDTGPAAGAPGSEAQTGSSGPATQPAPDDQPAGGELAEPGSAHGASAACPRWQAAVPAGLRLAGYQLVGAAGSDERARLERVLDATLRRGSRWEAETGQKITEMLGRFQYCVQLELLADRPGYLALRLEPFSLVRRVTLKDQESWWHGARWRTVHRFFANLLERSIKSRINLRPGDPLPDDPEARRQALESARDRVLTYLESEGYFDAQVEAAALQAPGSKQVELEIRVHKGAPYRVGSVKVVGATAIPARELAAMFEQPYLYGLTRDRFAAGEHQRDIERAASLYHARGFPEARIETSFDPRVSLDRLAKTVNFVVTVDEGTRVDVEFAGNRHLSAASLLKVVTFATAGVFDELEATASATQIRRAYEKSGYFQAAVTWRRERQATSTPERRHERITFTIDEGPRLVVVSVGFSGNRSLPADELRTVIATKAFPGQIAQLLAAGGYVTAVQLDQDVEALVEHYHQAGFPSVHVEPVVATDPRLLEDVGAMAAAVTAGYQNGGLHVLFRIDEGPRALVGKIEFRGNHALNDADLERAATLRRGAPFTKPRLKQDVEAIVRLYANHGRPHATIEAHGCPPVPEGEAPQAPCGRARPGTIDVIYMIEEDAAVRFGEVFVRGNFKTRGWVIRDVANLPKGRPFTFKDLELAERNLRKTRLFSAVTLDPVGYDQKWTAVHPLITVREAQDNHGILGVGGGYSLEWNGPYAHLDYPYGNLFGVGAGFNLEGELGYDFKRDGFRGYAKASLDLPRWVIRRAVRVPADLDVSLAYTRTLDDRFGLLQTLEIGPTFSRLFGKDEEWLVTLGYSWRRYNRKADLTRPSGANEDIDNIGIQTTAGRIAATLTYTQLEDDQGNRYTPDPTRGYRLDLGAQYASRYLFGTDDFVKLSLSAKRYWPIGTRARFTAGLRYNHGIPIGSALLPDVERFFAGGDSTVRGIAPDHLLNEVVWRRSGPILEYELIPAGGNIRVLANADLQLKVWDKAFFGMPLATALFFDSGLVTQSFDLTSFGPNQIRYSAGMALARVVFPGLGSFSLEYAVPLNPKIGDDPLGRFHFNLGFVF